MDIQTIYYLVAALVLFLGIGASTKLYLTAKKSKELPEKAASRLTEEGQDPLLVDSDVIEESTAELSEEPVAVVAPPVKASKDLRSALENTRSHFFGRIKSVISNESKMTDDDMEELEEILYTSDLGPATVQRLVEAVSEKIDGKDKGSLEAVQNALRGEMSGIFSELNEKSEELNDIDQFFKSVKGDSEAKPRVLMIVGVNGVGKTTTIGKLAHKSAEAGLKTMVVAGDTFRAAAEDQLKVWADRAGVEVFSPEGVKDPSAVAFDGVKSAAAKELDMVIVDTAGRLHTQDNLMEELKKMRRVIGKVLPGAPHEVLLVLDANSGQNALMQAKSFHQSLDLDGVVLTKLDGSAKGGVAVGIACELKLPIKLIGVGEGIEDLRPFNSEEFIASII